MFLSSSTLISLAKRDRTPIVVFALVSLVILGPLLLPGYILTLDMSWPPQWKFPERVANGYPLYVLLTILNSFISSMLLQKLMLWSVFFIASLSTYLLVRHLHIWTKTPFKLAAGYFAGLLYAINPFTYDRLMDGQWLVLIGYALLPAFVLALLRLLENNSARRIIELTLVTIVISYTSIHMMYMLLVLAVAPVGMKLYRVHRNKLSLIQHMGALLAVGAATVLANIFWLSPGNDLSQISSFDMRHVLTFRSVGDSFLTAPFNLLTLGGYWGEVQGRFMTAKSITPLWPVLIVTIIGLAGIGVKTLWSRSRGFTVMFLGAGIIGWAIAVGVSAPGFREAFIWIGTTLPYFQGYREPQKFIALLALAYAVLAGFGASRTLLSKPAHNYRIPLTALLLALPILYTPTLLWGGLGQLRAVDYPSDWYVLKRKLTLESPTPTALFLPWHQYLYLDFAGRTVASPGTQFFTTPIIQSNDPSLGLIRPRNADKTEEFIERELLAKVETTTTAGETLERIGVKYIVVSKTADWRTYSFLAQQEDLTLISDTKSLLVYSNDKMR